MRTPLLILLFWSQITISQSMFLPREIITIQKNTVEGYIFSDTNLIEISQSMSFSKTSIGENLNSNNEIFQKDYTLAKNKSTTKTDYAVVVGIPIMDQVGGRVLKFGAYRFVTHIKDSNSFSLLNGIFYTVWKNKTKWAGEYAEGSSGYKNERLDIIPLGVRFQLKAKTFIPYFHFGLGLGLEKYSDYVIKDSQINGIEKGFYALIATTIAIGFKIRLKSDYIMAEFTPSGNGSFINVGYSF